MLIKAEFKLRLGLHWHSIKAMNIYIKVQLTCFFVKPRPSKARNCASVTDKQGVSLSGTALSLSPTKMTILLLH